MEKDNFDAKEVEDAFNLLVQLARNAKLTYHEHSKVDSAVNLIFDIINSNVSKKSENTHHVVQHLNEEEQRSEEQ
jgi:predicted amidohydrolase YtcJ